VWREEKQKKKDKTWLIKKGKKNPKGNKTNDRRRRKVSFSCKKVPMPF